MDKTEVKGKPSLKEKPIYLFYGIYKTLKHCRCALLIYTYTLCNVEVIDTVLCVFDTISPL